MCSRSYEIENAICIKSTGQAILVEAPDFGDEQVWIPQSQIVNKYEFYKEGTEGTLVVSKWLAEQRGWL